MVLENLFPENWLEKKHSYAFILASSYTILSLIISRLIFPQNSGIVSIAFITILLMPYLEKLIAKEEKNEEKEKVFTFKELWKDNKTTITVYSSLFAGIFFTYSFFTLILPFFGIDTSHMFAEQLGLDSLSGNAFSMQTFSEIFLNNWWVLLAVFMIALIAGEGTLFFITWNASVWGAIFGFRAFASAVAMGGGLGLGLWNYLLIFIIVLPHLILETAAYLFAGIAGEIISDDVMKKASEMKEFVLYALFLFIVYGLLSFLFRSILPNILFVLVNILMIAGGVYFLKNVFSIKKHQEVFYYNYVLLMVAIAIFVVAAVVETSVLMNSHTLQNIYYEAFQYSLG